MSAVVITEEVLVAAGVAEGKAKEILGSKEKAEIVQALFGQAIGICGSASQLGEARGKAVLEAAQKLKATVSPAAKAMLVELICRKEGAGIHSPEQLTAAMTFLNKGGAEPTLQELEAAGGVGIVVTEEDIRNAVLASIQANHDSVQEQKHHAVATVMKDVRAKHPFGSGSKIKAVTDEEFVKLFGPPGDLDAERKELSRQKRKETKKSNKEAAAAEPAASAAAAAAVPEPAAAAAAEPAAAAAAGAEAPKAHKEQVITPWEVDAEDGVDYTKLIKDFGCDPITPQLLDRLTKLNIKLHRFLRRGIFFSHRSLDVTLDGYEKGKPFYLYTGRGPSSDSMHLGHLIPFIFTKYLQEAFNVPLVIQMTDDEKYLVKENLTLDADPKTGVTHMLYENAKDIIACGFDPKRTFIFSDLEYMGGEFYKNVVKVQKRITVNQATHCFGIEGGDNIGKMSFVAVQAAPSFPSSFPHLLKGDEICLVPCAIDQDPYFRLTRDVAPRIGYEKPSLIHSKFFPAMTGSQTKMSSSTNSPTTIFLTDTPEMIADKVKKYAFSGAPSTLEEHRLKGANTDVDVAYQYLTFFLEDDEELERIRSEYSTGKMTTAQVKQKLIAVLQEVVLHHQKERAKITDETVRQFMSTAKRF
eukprot:m.9959 g.9959  ORF g.9959 m.9959 type:complete len:640 (-) comp5101_c0_seq1:188-2107(-)